MELRGRTCWVLGLGRSGCAAGALLRRRGARVIGLDDAARDALETRWTADEYSDPAAAFDEVLAAGADPAGAAARPDLVVVSPGVPPTHRRLAERGDAPLIGELELGARFCRATMAAITGTNGKSTVTALTAHLVAQAGRRGEALGNLGRPLCLLAEELEPEDVAVIEVSSFQLENLDTFRPLVGAVLNLAPDHLDRYPDLAAYYAAKRVLAERIRPEGVFVTWTGCPEARGWPTPARRVLFGARDDGAAVHYADGALVVEDEGAARPLLKVPELAQQSPPNLLNALAAVALGRALGLPRDAMAAGLRDFPGLPHRHQLVARRGGVRFIDDSKATNVHSVTAGLDGYASEVVLIAGGSGKGEDYAPLRAVMGAVRHVVLIGREGPAIGAALEGCAPTSTAPDMDAAVALAADLAEPDAAVLLSPACASFDMFANYHHRGEAFAAAAEKAGARRI